MDLLQCIQLETTNAPEGRYSFAGAFIEESSELVIHGGITTGKTSNDFWKLDLSNLHWTLGPSTDLPLNGHGGVSVNNNLLMVGGWSGKCYTNKSILYKLPEDGVMSS